MEDVTKLVENYTSVFQQCLLAKDPAAHARTLADSLEKNLLLFLLQPHSQEYRDVLRTKYQIRGQLLESINKWKTYSRITKATKPEDITYLIEKFLKEHQHAYNYAKPAEFHSTADDGKSEEHTLPAKLKPIKALAQWAAQEITKNEDIVSSLSKKALKSLSQDRLLKLKTINKQRFLNLPYLKDYPDKFAIKFIQSFYEQMLKTNQNYQLPTHILYSLSKSQFMALKDAVPTLINKDQYLRVWFAHSYDEELQAYQKEDLTISEKDQKRKVLLKILKDLEHLKTAKTKSMRRNVLKQLLLLDISRQEVDKSVFIEYIKDNPNSSSFENQKVRKYKSEARSKKSKAAYEDNIDLCLQSSSTGEDQIIKDSLEILFKNKDAAKILKELEEYFEVSLLNKIYAAVKLSQGGKLEDYQNYLAPHELKELKQKKQITIVDSNKKKWKADEQVQLKVRVKNINDIHVQVYRIDLEKHFTENGSQIDQTQNLSYLQPNHSYHYATENKSPYLVQNYDIKIEGVPQGRGVWIVELEGEGISSRAFIRKGAIASTNTNNSVGTDVKFFDQSGSQIKDFTIWMQGKKHAVQSSFTIPYGQSDKNLSLIVLKDGYAEKFDVYVPRESYYLDIAYIYNTESFIVGSIAKVLLHPRLNLSFDRSMDVSFKLLEKVKILVTLTNNLGIKSTIDFDNVKFKATQDYVLQFPIQSYTTKIDIQISAKIKKYNKIEQDLTSAHTIDINLSEGNTNFLDLYLRKKKEGYAVFLLGKNGEPVPRTEVIIQVLAEGRSQEESQNLMTTKDGSVDLGDLKGVNKVTAKVNLKSGSVMRSWNLDQTQSQVQILAGTVFHEGEEVVFPVPYKQHCQLWRVLVNSGVYTENHTNKVVCEDSKVTIKGLPVGQYALDFIESDTRVDFTVVQGKVWENEHKIYDQKKEMLWEVDPEQNNHFSLGDAAFKHEEGKTIVEIPVRATYDLKKDQSFRAHLMVSNFIVPDFNGQFEINNLRGIRQVKQQAFYTKQSEFYNNKRLSEESSYVVNRGKQKKYIGNNLQKPRVFLKRIEVRDTTQSEQVLANEGDYIQSRAMKQKAYRPQMSACPPQYGARGYAMSTTSAYVAPFVNPMDITTHNNFLSLPGSIVSNHKEGDVLKFVVPGNYSHFQCFAFSKVSCILKKFNQPIEDTKNKSLSHAGIQASSKDTAWTMSRQVYKAQKGQTIKVGRDSVWSAVGLSNVAGFAKIKGATLEDWVTNWNTYSQQQKLKTFDDKVCHQLNTYIKYNDRPFFNKVVHPFIKNKVTKTFVDLCLLDHKDALNWTDLSMFQLLNQFEKVLLVHQLVKAGRREEAEAIANAMESVNKSNRKSFEQFKKEFDSVITAKLTEEIKNAPQLQAFVRMAPPRPSFKPAMQCEMMMDMCAPQEECLREMSCEQQCEQAQLMDDVGGGGFDVYKQRARVSQPFKQMEKTKEYTETTYWKIKYPEQSRTLVSASPFWASAAQHFATGKGEFLSQNFMYLNSTVEFTLASCFIPNQKLLEYGLTNQGQHVSIAASSSFLIFVREVKSLPYEKKFGVLINQRFFNPDDRYYYEEDGTRIEKQTDQFIVRRPYCVQTLITNTSGTKLELQLLIDVPEGSVPLKSHQNTQIQSINLEPYSTLSFERFFYFPKTGSFTLYPANACRGGSVIAKAEQIPKIQVLQTQTVKKMDTLQNILKSGKKQSILQYLKTKNIFDTKIFDPSNILWMLKDKQFFLKVIDTLRTRKYYLSQIWIFGYYHNDLTTITQFQKTQHLQNHENILSNLPIFEYFPYYSSRAHKFLNQNKSTIRNEQFKKTYFNFLFASLFNQPTSSRSRVAFIYYLLLQDRIDEAHGLLKEIDDGVKEEHKLQFDYIECFIDMYKGYPSFSRARKIVAEYTAYPVKSWQKMFTQISDTLRQYDSQQMIQQNKQIEYTATVLNEGPQLRLSIPADTTVEVCLYDVNLELYFSTFPFTDVQSFCSNITPNNVKVYASAFESREEKFVRDGNMKDCFVEVYSSTSGLKRKKISSFLWSNPSIKIKLKQDSGYAQIFHQSKKQAGCYCKVYQMKDGQPKFYRDGYSDITGTFKYALADLEGVTEFAILFVTDCGGVVERVKPPSQQAYLA